jgi:hypothetical protein
VEPSHVGVVHRRPEGALLIKPFLATTNT